MCAENERTDISRCGTNWDDANRRCSNACSVDDGACAVGQETCFANLKRACKEESKLPLILGMCGGAAVLLLLGAFCYRRASPPFNLQRQTVSFHVSRPVKIMSSPMHGGPER